MNRASHQHSQHIAVVGAGFAGLASAALLARAGHAVTVFEKFATPQSIGAGILIQPSGLAAMRALGIADDIIARGGAVRHLFGVNHRQRPVLNLSYDAWRPGAFGLGLHRGVLFEALWRLCAQNGVKLVTGQEITELSAVRSAFNLVVIADGANSRLRAQTGLPYRDRLYPWGAVWAVLDDLRPAAIDLSHRDPRATLLQWVRGASEMLGIMPTGELPGASAQQARVVSLFWSLHEAAYPAWRSAGLGAFKQQVLALNPSCAPFLEQITHMEQLTWARYRDVSMPRYHTPADAPASQLTSLCVVIGDAAHATSPQLGQGTNLALLDAVTLADCITQAPNLPAALDAYTQTRKAHLRFYGQASRWMTPAFQSHQRILPWLRDAFMAQSMQWPVVGAFCRQTLVGVRTSWVRPGGVLQLS